VIICPICKERCEGGIGLHRHQAAFHSQAEIDAHQVETDAAEFEANHDLVRERERLDNGEEFGGD